MDPDRTPIKKLNRFPIAWSHPSQFLNAEGLPKQVGWKKWLVLYYLGLSLSSIGDRTGD
jgi:hypothetical protein